MELQVSLSPSSGLKWGQNWGWTQTDPSGKYKYQLCVCIKCKFMKGTTWYTYEIHITKIWVFCLIWNQKLGLVLKSSNRVMKSIIVVVIEYRNNLHMNRSLVSLFLPHFYLKCQLQNFYQKDRRLKYSRDRSGWKVQSPLHT